MKTETKGTYNLPTGKETTSQKRYLREWGKIQKTLLNKYGLRVIGFDPGFTVCDERDNKGFFELPMYAALRLCNFASSLPRRPLLGKKVSILKKRIEALEQKGSVLRKEGKDSLKNLYQIRACHDQLVVLLEKE